MKNRDQLWDQHTPMEATGGYIECSCGWPERVEWESGMHYAEHLLADAWDEGYTVGNAHNGRRDANPYRLAEAGERRE